MKHGGLWESPRMQQVTGGAIRPGGLALTKRAIGYCDFPRRARLLDVGCGLGATVEYLVDEHGFDAAGVEPSALLLNAKRAQRPDLTLIRGEASQLPIESGSSDGLFIECVFSLLDNQQAALAEFARVLKNNGTLIISDLYARNPAALDSIRDRGIRSCVTGAQAAAHYVSLIEAGGFDLLLWEDHSRYLAELAGRMILADLPLESLFEGATDDPDDASFIVRQIREARLGYFLLIAKNKRRGAGN